MGLASPRPLIHAKPLEDHIMWRRAWVTGLLKAGSRLGMFVSTRDSEAQHGSLLSEKACCLRLLAIPTCTGVLRWLFTSVLLRTARKWEGEGWAPGGSGWVSMGAITPEEMVHMTLTVKERADGIYQECCHMLQANQG